ncbi:MAG: hypothetical protein WCD53_17080 [Microcoleus sp.]
MPFRNRLSGLFHNQAISCGTGFPACSRLFATGRKACSPLILWNRLSGLFLMADRGLCDRT